MLYEFRKYCNGNLCANITKDVKNQQVFIDLYVGIVMVLKKSAIIYKTYMRALHIWNGLMEIKIERM
jgi:hypothetical protein